MTKDVEKLQDLVNRIKSSDNMAISIQALKSSTEEVLRRCQNNLMVSIGESCEKDMANFNESMKRNLNSVCNAWVESQSRQMIVFPENTRFVHRDSSRLQILVEQKPTIRVINFLGTSYRISLPFVQFFMNFQILANNYDLNRVQIGCTTKSVTSLSDQIYRLPMPNNGSQLCFGDILRQNPAIQRGTDITQKCNSFIDAFWQSEFNTDIADFCATWCRNNFNGGAITHSNYELDLKNLFKIWQTKSASDPLFVLQKSCTYDNFQRVSECITANFGADGTQATVNRLVAELESCSKSYIQNVTKAISSANLLEENRNSVHTKNLNEQINKIVNFSYEDMWETVHKDHEIKCREDERVLRNREVLVTRDRAILDRDSEQFKSVKAKFDGDVGQTQIELYNIYQYLQKQLAEVESMRAKLVRNFDENGNVLPKASRGRPKKKELPIDVQMSMSNVESSGILIGPDGQPVEKKKRGRPKKNSAA